MRLHLIAGVAIGGASLLALAQYFKLFSRSDQPVVIDPEEAPPAEAHKLTHASPVKAPGSETSSNAADSPEQTTRFPLSAVEDMRSREFINITVIDLLKKEFIKFSSASKPAVSFTEIDPDTQILRFRIRYPSSEPAAPALPTMDDILSIIPPGSVTSILVTSSLPGDGFWPIVVPEGSRQQLAFTIEGGTRKRVFEPIILPKDAPGAEFAMHTRMETVFKPVLGACCVVRAGAVVVFSPDAEAHARDLAAVTQISAANQVFFDEGRSAFLQVLTPKAQA
mmetsp:Transcript_52806/g.110213  ORF Transcript_52806/g.110213 Transcript_52806/m.110213 type:complete len:280 (-) Transcript_52806:93-932(-)